MFDSKTFLKSVTTLPGVYQMLDEAGGVLYVGKAKNLKKRLSSYFGNKKLAPKTQALVEQIADVRVTVAHSENEALVLESNLIKTHLPKYNILLRDDKSYPYIILTKRAKYPKLDIYRGQRKRNAEFFGPYPSVGAVRETLKLLQKLFKLRQCSDAFFNARKRPCMQFQIKRCKAPCVGFVEQDDYAKDVEFTRLFLQGKSQAILKDLVKKMDACAEMQEYELAASYRDLIAKLKEIQSRQYVTSGYKDVDVFAVVQQASLFAVAYQKIRHGELITSQCFFPKVPAGADIQEVLASFVSQYYFANQLTNDFPREVVLSHAFDGSQWLEDALSEKAGRKVKLCTSVRGVKSKWVAIATKSAEQNLLQKKMNNMKDEQRWQSLQEALALSSLPNRIECFDISHTQGEATVASCVVVDKEGAQNRLYRRFNITGITPGDDYAAIEQAVTRRYKRLQKEGSLPDVVLIDGGKGQYHKAVSALHELGLDEQINVLGIAKGVDRKPGLETFIMNDKTFTLPADHAGMHLLQFIRDESHRFAILGHRQKRKKTRQTSVLEKIPGIGAKRRSELLKHFGGLQGLSKASVEEIAGVSGINRSLAEKIYGYFHG